MYEKIFAPRLLVQSFRVCYFLTQALNYGMYCVPPKVHIVEVLNSSVTILGARVFKEIIKVK